jgi:Concanavalin A-like lectin/glucanases superfamily
MPRVRYEHLGFAGLTGVALTFAACQSFVYRGSDFDVTRDSDGGQDSAPIRDSYVADGTATDSGAPLDAAADTTSDITYAQMIMRDRPLAYYRFSDSDVDRGLNDNSGNQLFGSFEPNCSLKKEGAIAGDDNYAISSSDGGALAPKSIQYSATDSFSLESWATFGALNTNYQHLFNKEINSGGRQQFGVYLTTSNGDGLAFERFVNGAKLFASTGLKDSVNDDVIVVNESAWHHIVATYDGSNLAIYLDGTIRRSVVDRRTQSVRNTTQPLLIGTKFANAPVNQWQGRIDEVAVYSYALTARQVTQHYMKVTQR